MKKFREWLLGTGLALVLVLSGCGSSSPGVSDGDGSGGEMTTGDGDGDGGDRDGDGDGDGSGGQMGDGDGDGDGDSHNQACTDEDSDGYFVGCDDFNDTYAGPDCDDADALNWESCDTCVDEDADGKSVGCDAYPEGTEEDCDDEDMLNWVSCETCTDDDGDGFLVGCDAYSDDTSADCDDADVDNWVSCATCEDADSDTYFAGCDAYTTRTGVDCDDAKGNAWVSCDTCVDADSDGHSVGCDDYSDASEDCSDADPNNWDSCGSCVDSDGDDYHVACDAYVTLSGPDCSDGDVDNWTACGTCADADSDSYYAGCNAYTTRLGSDCNNSDPNVWASCGTCSDSDGDDHYTGCDAYVTVDEDCDDSEGDMWDTCDTCGDEDADGYFTGCNVYVDRSGPDCDDSDPLENPGELEVADDGLDNDCSAGDLLAASGTGIYVADTPSCSDVAATRGSMSVPYCSVQTAWTEVKSGDFFIAEGTYFRTGGNTTASHVNLNGNVRVQGGYEATGWTRDVENYVTTIDTDGFLALTPLNFSGTEFVLNGLSWRKTANNYSGNYQVYVTNAQKVSISAMTMSLSGQSFPLVVYGDDVVVRDNDFHQRAFGAQASAGIEVTAALRLQVSGNTLDLEAQGGYCRGMFLRGLAPSKVVINNALRCAANSAYSTARGIHVWGGGATLVNNSVHVDGPTNSPNNNAAVYVQTADWIDVVNNAISVDGTDSVALQELHTTGIATISMVNNLFEVYSGTASFSRRTTNTLNFTYGSPSDVNDCLAAHCGQSAGNALAQDLFNDVDTADFSAPPGGATIDAGIDPSAYYDGPEIYESLESWRPQDGDGVSGAQWDVGALEAPNPNVN